MTKLLEQAIEAIRKLPPQRQDELAEVLSLAASDEATHYTSEQLAAIDEGVDDAEAGRFTTDAEVVALFAKFRSA